MRSLHKLFTLAIVVTALSVPVMSRAQTPPPIESFVIIIDQSADMHRTYHNQSMNYLARQVAKDIIKNIPQEMDLKGAIYSYGVLAAETKHQVIRIQSLKQFDRAMFLRAMDKVEPQKGPATLSVALRRHVKYDLANTPGRTIIFVISSGSLTDTEDPAPYAKELKQAKPQTCIHTILIGKSRLGGKRLKEVADKSKCGSATSSSALGDGSKFSRYIKLVFNPPGIDQDGDGVVNANDKCKDTPIGASVDANGCWSVNQIRFEVGKWDIKPEYYELLDEIASVMNVNPDLKIKIVGHTDSDGTDEDNLKLSERRAQAVLNYLIQQGEVDSSRLSSIGMGESAPVASNSTPEGKAENRRIEFQIIQ